MPSEDPINPEANKWLYRDGSGKLHEIVSPEPGQEDSKIAKAAQAAHVQKLAARLGLPAEYLAKLIPEDTLRRLKYSVLEQTDENGLAVFKHDIGIIRDQVKPSVGVDRHAHEAIPKGDNGRGADSGRSRDASGKFTK